jgi:uncharacterized paraquat-inducible protein A
MIMRTANYQFVPVVVRWIIIAMTIALALLIASVAAACPTCKDGLAQNDPHGQSLAAGYYYSILFMMAMPFAILGTFGSLAYLSIRRARLESSDQSDNYAEASPDS